MKNLIRKILKEEGEKKPNIFVPHNVEGRKIEKEKRDREKIDACKKEFKELLSRSYVMKPYQDGIIFFNENDEWMFDYDVKKNVCWLSYVIVWSVFYEKYSLNYYQIKELTQDTLREVGKLQDVTTDVFNNRRIDYLRELGKLQDVTTNTPAVDVLNHLREVGKLQTK